MLIVEPIPVVLLFRYSVINLCTTSAGFSETVCNTLFNHHPRRLWTWKSPNNQTKNQIDYITINKRFRNAVIQTKGFPGADCNSDHDLLVATVKLKLKKTKQSKPPARLCLASLKNREIRQKYQNTVQLKLNESGINLDTCRLEEEYHQLTKVVIDKRCCHGQLRLRSSTG